MKDNTNDFNQPGTGIRNEMRTYPFVMAWRTMLMDNSIPDHIYRMYVYLCARCTSDTKITWVSLKTIARDRGYKSTGSVHKYLKELEKRGLVAIKTEVNRNTGVKRSEYTVLDPYRVYGDRLYNTWNDFWEENRTKEILETDEAEIIEENETSLSPVEQIDLPGRTTNSLGESVQVEEYNNKNLSIMSHLEGDSITEEPSLPDDEQSKPSLGVSRIELLKGGLTRQVKDESDFKKEMALEAKKRSKAQKEAEALQRREERARNAEICPEGVSRLVWEEQQAPSLLFTFYREKMATYGFGSVPRATGKEMGQLKTFWIKCDKSLDKAKETMDSILKDWSKHRAKHNKLGEAPSIGLFASGWLAVLMSGPGSAQLAPAGWKDPYAD